MLRGCAPDKRLWGSGPHKDTVMGFVSPQATKGFANRNRWDVTPVHPKPMRRKSTTTSPSPKEEGQRRTIQPFPSGHSWCAFASNNRNVTDAPAQPRPPYKYPSGRRLLIPREWATKVTRFCFI